MPRVKVDNPRVVGKITPAIVLRETRKLHYWPIRRCYDAALAKDQALRGSVTVRFTIKANGQASAGSVVGQPTLKDRDTGRCIAASFSSLHFPRPTKGTAKVTIDIALNPGDAPMRGSDDPAVEPGPGSIDMQAFQAVTANNGVSIIQCYQQGLARVPGLWGRMALRLDLDPNGAVRDAVESESTFPDSQTTQCVIDALKKIQYPAPTSGDLRVIVPIRFGNLPSNAQQAAP
jgi:hypothetical protein